jgi:serine/threonine-protein kinase
VLSPSEDVVDEEGRDDLTGVKVGDVLAGKYRVERVLGIGAMGVVVAAHDAEKDTRVAVKFLRPAMMVHREAHARFSREGRAAIQLKGPHVARVFEVGTLENGAPYMAMELLEGEDLATLLQRQGPCGVEESVHYVVEACEAVAEAHGLGIVHRDLKPANLFLCRRPDGRGAIKVLDFGVSKVSTPGSSVDQKLTLVSSLVGSPLYMSPEQIETPDTVDSRADIWALGVILYELLTTKTPFVGDTLPQVSIKIAVRPHVPIRDVRPEVPEGLARAIATCLEKARSKRYADVAELARAIAPFASADVASSSIAPVSSAPAMGVTDTVAASVLSSTGGTSSVSTHPTTLPDDDGGNPGRPTLPSRHARDRRWNAFTAALAVAAALTLTISVASTRRARPIDGVAAVRRGAATTAPPASPTAVTNALSEAPTTVAVASSPSDSSWSVAEFPAVPPTARPAAPGNMSPGAARRSAVAAGAARPGCEVDFELDSQGRKHFKPECVTGVQASLSPAASAKAACDPNYDLDDQGRKHFKPQCFLNASP